MGFVIALHLVLEAEDRDVAEGIAKAIERFATKRGCEVLTDEVYEDWTDRER
jgi:hypothetical protein